MTGGSHGEKRSTMQAMGTISHRKNAPLAGRLYQAYVALMLAPEGKDGARTVTLARYGAFEVRLTEFRTRGAADVSSLRIELRRRDTRSLHEAAHFDDLLDAEPVVERFMARARELHEAQAGSDFSSPLKSTRLSSGNFFDSNL